MIWILKCWCFWKSQKNSFRILWTRPSKISLSSRISLTCCFKKDGYRIRLINRCWYASKEIRTGMCNAVHQYAKASNKYMDDYDENKNHHLLIFGMWIICMGGKWYKSSPHLFLNGSKILHYLIKFSLRTTTKIKKAWNILEVDVNYPEKYTNSMETHHFHLEEKKLKSLKAYN